MGKMSVTNIYELPQINKRNGVSTSYVLGNTNSLILESSLINLIL